MKNKTEYTCAGQPLKAGDAVRERYLDTSSGQPVFRERRWKITEHDHAFWRCCNKEEIKLDSDLDMHFSIIPTGPDDSCLQEEELTIVSQSQHSRASLFAKLAIGFLIAYIILRLTPFPIAANISAVISAIFAILTFKYGGFHHEKKV